MIRVAHLLDGKHFGGGEGAVVRLARFADRERVSVEALCMAEGRLTELLAKQNTPFRLISRPRGIGIVAARETARLIRENRIDIVHSHTSRTNLLGRMAALMSHAVHVATIQSPVRLDINDRPRRRWLPDLVDRLGARWSERIVFVCQEERLGQIERGLPKPKAAWIPNGVEMVPAPDPRRIELLRAKWGIEPGQPVVCMIAQLRPRKGPDVLLRAVPHLLKKVPGAIVILAGSAEFVSSRDYMEELKGLAEQLGIEEHVRFVGFCHDVRAALELTDVFALPSVFGEGLPLVLLESMEAGRAIVTTDTAGNREAVLDGRNGLLVPPGDSEALAGALARLLSDGDLRARMGVEGRKLAEGVYDMHGIARAHENLYAEILGISPDSMARQRTF